MNDFQENPDNFNGDKDNSNPSQHKKTNIWLDLLIGLGISAIAYALAGVASFAKVPMAMTALIEFLILAVFGFLVVKFFRTQHTAAAIIMLVLISPAVLALLLFGACALIIAPFSS